MMAKRLAPVLKAHGVIDEHGAYVAPVFSTPELPPQLGEYLFQRLSPAFRFKVDPALLPPTFALSRTAGDTVEMQPYGFMLGQGADIVTVTLLAQTDWNDDGLNEGLPGQADHRQEQHARLLSARREARRVHPRAQAPRRLRLFEPELQAVRGR